MPRKAVEITAAILNKASASNDVPLIVDFWAAWCGPSKMMGPEFDKAAQALSGKMRIKGIPTMIGAMLEFG